MKQFSLMVCLVLLFVSRPVYGQSDFVLDFRDGKPVSGGELVHLISLIERRVHGYEGQRITEVIVYADSANHRHGGYVSLLDEDRRVISEDRLSNGYASLPVHGRHQSAAFLTFEQDVFLNRIEFATEGHTRAYEQGGERYPREYEQREDFRRQGGPGPARIVEIGNFFKPNYEPEAKNFSIAPGGYSKIRFRVQVREKFAVIVNSIVVLSHGKKRGGTTIGARLVNGDNEFALDVPADATDIRVSFDHGKGSSVQVFLLP